MTEYEKKVVADLRSSSRKCGAWSAGREDMAVAADLIETVCAERDAAIAAADVQEVRRGAWILSEERQFCDGSNATTFYCSLCGRVVTVNHEKWYGARDVLFNSYPYCNCGADMRGKGDV